MTRYLVTGASGFIGTHLVRALAAAGAEVTAVGRTDGDVADDATWARFPDVDVVIHLAGKSFVPDSWLDPTGFMRSNLLGTVAALNFARLHRARLVYLSSYLYGNPRALPIPETAATGANNPYALSKTLAETACKFFADSFGVPVRILRPFNVYGPGQSSSFLIPLILRQVTEGVAIRVKDLEPRRDYVYVADVVRAILSASRMESPFEVFNVGSGVSHSVKELIDMIQAVWDTQLPVAADGERRKDEIMDTVADIAHAKRLLNWQPAWSLAAGLAEMRDLTQENQ